MSYDDRRVAADLSRRPTTGPTTADWLPETAPPAEHPASAEALPAEPGELPASETPGSARRAARVGREVVETLLLALVIFVGVRLVVLNFRVDGASMVPNLINREMLLVNRNVYFHFDLNEVRNLLPGDDRNGDDLVYPFHPPERGDIVVFDPPIGGGNDKPYIKRVIGLPGETVTFDGGSVLIDGQRLEEPYIEGGITECPGRPGSCETKVPAGEIYVLGDNRDNSSDSRSFGPVDVDDIVGKAWFSYWPLDELGLVPHYDYPEIPDST